MLSSNRQSLEQCVSDGTNPNFDYPEIAYDDESGDFNELPVFKGYKNYGRIWSAVTKSVVSKNPTRNFLTKLIDRRLTSK